MVRCSLWVRNAGVGRLRATTARVPWPGIVAMPSVRNLSSPPFTSVALFQPAGSLGSDSAASGTVEFTRSELRGELRWARAAARRIRRRARWRRHQAREWRRYRCCWDAEPGRRPCAVELAKGSMTTSETNINNDRVIVRNIEFLFPLGHRFADYFLESGYSGANLVQSRFA